MDQNTVDKIYENAKEAREIYIKFLAKNKQADLFRQCFHLRPTSKGVTIVSTLPEGPMRGIDCCTDDLAGILRELNKQLKKFVANDEQTVKTALTTLGFKQRSNVSKNEREENTQARFIQGMVKGKAAFDGIQFVASEFNLEGKKRFDVVGVKDDTLYIFELKRGRVTSAINQVDKYCEHIKTNIDHYCRVLDVYPNLEVKRFKDIQGIAVMEWAKNSRSSTWSELLNNKKIRIWFFERSLSFYDHVGNFLPGN